MISIIIPFFNVSPYIKDTIDSVLRQTYTDWEMILIDDGSTDDSVTVLDQYFQDVLRQKRFEHIRVRLIKHSENRGAYAARNTGLSVANGRYIAFLDGDDIWRSDKLELELSYSKEHNAGFVFSGYEFADAAGNKTGKVVYAPRTLNYKQLLGNTSIFTSTVLFDTQIIPKTDLYMPNCPSEDMATWFSILRKGYTAYGLNANLVRYRRVGSTLSSNKLNAVKRIWGLYRKQEKLSLPESVYYLIHWGIRAIYRRM